MDDYAYTLDVIQDPDTGLYGWYCTCGGSYGGYGNEDDAWQDADDHICIGQDA